MSVYTANYVEEKQRREAVVEMMRAGDWRGVIHSFHGGEEARWGRGSVYSQYHNMLFGTSLSTKTSHHVHHIARHLQHPSQLTSQKTLWKRSDKQFDHDLCLILTSAPSSKCSKLSTLGNCRCLMWLGWPTCTTIGPTTQITAITSMAHKFLI